MNTLKTIYSVDRIPYTAAAKSTVGDNPSSFEVVTESETDAVEQTQRLSRYGKNEFTWIVRGSRMVLAPNDSAEDPS